MDAIPTGPLLPGRADHAAADEVRTRYWVDRLRRLGPEESFRVAHGLLRYVRQQRPDWPSREDRETDLAAHIALSDALRRG